MTQLALSGVIRGFGKLPSYGPFSFVHAPVKIPTYKFFLLKKRELQLLNMSFVTEVLKTLWLSRKI